MRIILCAALALLINSGVALAEEPMSESEYLAKIKTAAPEQIVSRATIVMMHEGKPHSLQTGYNGFTCMIDRSGTPMCGDENAMAWLNALLAKQDPPNKIGFIYMLAGDSGTNNVDPYGRMTHEHWVQTGPHVMVVGPMVKEMGGYSRTADVSDASQPYVMWPGTPYEHLMLPVATGSGAAVGSTAPPATK